MKRKDLIEDLFGDSPARPLPVAKRPSRKRRPSSQSTPPWMKLKARFAELYREANGREYRFANNRNEQETLETFYSTYRSNPELMYGMMEFWFKSGQTKIPVQTVSVYHLKGGWLNNLEIDTEAYLKGTYTPHKGETKRNREWIPQTSVASVKPTEQEETRTEAPKKKRKRNLL